MAVTAAVTPILIRCANTLGAALREAEHGANAQRTFRSIVSEQSSRCPACSAAAAPGETPPATARGAELVMMA
jgi:hypothetical protein